MAVLITAMRMHDNDTSCYDFPSIVRLRYPMWLILDPRTVDSYMLTFSLLLLDGHHLLYTNADSVVTSSLCTCSSSLWSCFPSPHVYKRPTMHHRNSKRVLFCTNTSRRWTCPFLILWTMILGEYPIPNYLSPEQLPCNCDLAIRVTTTRNIRTRFPKTPTTLEANLATREGCETEKEYLLGIFHQLRLRQTLHLRFCHIMCCIERNIEHEFLIAQWDALKVAWVNLRQAIERLNRENAEPSQTSASRQ